MLTIQALTLQQGAMKIRHQGRCDSSTVQNKRKFITNTNHRSRSLLFMSSSDGSSGIVLDPSVVAEANGRQQILEKVDSDLGFSIREATYQDLPSVANILVDSFYPPTPSVFRHYNLIKELARIQGNFPYDDSKHTMLVAVSNNDDNSVIGFCDIDSRPVPYQEKFKTAPRPYLSDLAVDISWRRKGIASSLILACELVAEKWNEDNLHLRVEAANTSALCMYAALGYHFVEHPYFGVKDTTMLLRRKLTPADDSLGTKKDG